MVFAAPSGLRRPPQGRACVLTRPLHTQVLRNTTAVKADLLHADVAMAQTPGYRLRWRGWGGSPVQGPLEGTSPWPPPKGQAGSWRDGGLKGTGVLEGGPLGAGAPESGMAAQGGASETPKPARSGQEGPPPDPFSLEPPAGATAVNASEEQRCVWRCQCPRLIRPRVRPPCSEDVPAGARGSGQNTQALSDVESAVSKQRIPNICN